MIGHDIHDDQASQINGYEDQEVEDLAYGADWPGVEKDQVIVLAPSDQEEDEVRRFPPPYQPEAD